VHPLVIAVHPQEPNQLAVGLTDGAVKVIEPLEPDGKWGASVPVENGAANANKTPASSGTSNPAAAADQPQR